MGAKASGPVTGRSVSLDSTSARQLGDPAPHLSLRTPETVASAQHVDPAKGGQELLEDDDAGRCEWMVVLLCR